MPSKDRTFSEKDVFRIIKKHLTRAEQFLVFRDLCGIFKPELLETELLEADLTVESESIEQTLFVEKTTFAIVSVITAGLPLFIASAIQDVVEDVEFLQAIADFFSERE